jgi:hypothetical protein
MVTESERASHMTDFFSEDKKLMEKVFLKSGKPYYLRAEGYSLGARSYESEDPFINIGSLFHSIDGQNQKTMDYRMETQLIEISDRRQIEVQEIRFENSPTATQFRLVIDNQETIQLSSNSAGMTITDALNTMSESECEDDGFVTVAYRSGMELSNRWPWGDRFTKYVEPFCGARSLMIDGSRTGRMGIFDSKKMNLASIDLSLNPHMCFAYIGAISGTIRLTLQTKSWRGIRTYDLSVSESEKWRYECWNVYNFVDQDELLHSKIGGLGVHLTAVDLSTIKNRRAYIDELIFGRVEGYFVVKQTKIGIRPSGYIQNFRAKWIENSRWARRLRIIYETDIWYA